jgi:hypothetical protein
VSKLAQSEQLIARMITRFAENGVMSEVVSTGTFFDDVSQDNMTAFIEALRWLEAESLVRTSAMPAIIGEPKDMKVRVVLTSLGFGLLGKSFGNGESIGTAVKKAGSGQGYANVGELLGGILGAFTKSISG